MNAYKLILFVGYVFGCMDLHGIYVDGGFSKLCDFSKPDYKSINEFSYCGESIHKTQSYNIWRKDIKEKQIIGKAYSKKHFHCYSQQTFFGETNVYEKSLKLERLSNEDLDIDKLCTGKNDPLYESDLYNENNDFDKLVSNGKLIKIPDFSYNKIGYKSVYQNNKLPYDNPTCHTKWVRTSDTNGHLCSEEDVRIVVNYKLEMNCDLMYCGNCSFLSKSCMTNFYKIKWELKEFSWSFFKRADCIDLNDKIICNAELFDIHSSFISVNGRSISGNLDSNGYIFFERISEFSYELDVQVEIDELYRMFKSQYELMKILYNESTTNCINLKSLIGSTQSCNIFVKNDNYKSYIKCHNNVLTIYPCVKVVIDYIFRSTCVDEKCTFCYNKLPAKINNNDNVYYYESLSNTLMTSSDKIRHYKGLTQEFLVHDRILVYEDCSLIYNRTSDPNSVDVRHYSHPFVEFEGNFFNNSEIEKLDINSMRQLASEERQFKNDELLSRIGTKIAKENPIPDLLNPNQMLLNLKAKVLSYLYYIIKLICNIGGFLYSLLIIRKVLCYAKRKYNKNTIYYNDDTYL